MMMVVMAVAVIVCVTVCRKNCAHDVCLKLSLMNSLC
jgi:hypothetical protein